MPRAQCRILIASAIFVIGFFAFPLLLAATRSGHHSLIESSLAVAGLGVWLAGSIWASVATGQDTVGTAASAWQRFGRWMLYAFELAVIMLGVALLFSLAGIALSGPSH